MAERKAFLLRLDPATHEALQRWADADLRSLNSQIEFLLRRAQNGLAVAKREGRNRVVEMTPDGPIWEMERRA